jgi:hypothetical protein
VSSFDSHLQFSLPSTQLLRKTLEQYLQQFKDCDDEMEITWKTWDIKQMFTNLAHDDIMNSIHEIINQLRLRSQCFTVAKWGRRGVHRGKQAFPNSDYVVVQLNEVIDVAKWSLSHCVFKLGRNSFMKQNIGAPMGDPLSPAFAIITCACAESRFLAGLGADERRLVMGTRYIDDLFVCVAYKKNDGKSRAKKILDKIGKHVYPRGLILESTGNSNERELEYLDAVISRTNIADVNLQVRWKNKNDRAYCPQKIVRFRAPCDASNPESQSAGILAVLHTINCHCSSDADIVQHGMELHRELSALGHKHPLLKEVRKMIEKSDRPGWRKLLHELQQLF